MPSFHTEQDGTEGGETDNALAPQQALTLYDAVALALLSNPNLAAYSYEERAADARIRQARVLPNPEIEVEVEEFDRGGEGFDSAETAISLWQMIELGGKRRWRTRVAQAEGKLAGWDYEEKRLEVFAEATTRFFAVMAAQRRLELGGSVVELAEKTAHAVGERVKAGKEPPLQASKASVELELARLDRQEAETTLAVARSKLSAMWGADGPHFETAAGDLNGISASLPTIDLLKSRLPSNPKLARRDAELNRAESVLSLEKASRMPDLEVRVGMRRFEEDGTDALAIGVGFPLPVFDRNQGNIAAATHELAKARSEMSAVQASLAIELLEAYAELTTAHKRALALREKVVPAMDETFRAAHAGYTQGKFGFLDMLDAQRGLFEATGELVEALLAYHITLTEIQRITGTSIEELELMDSKPKEMR